ncbi:MAG: RIP metalloprotease RseP [Pseudomonadota bacterium]
MPVFAVLADIASTMGALTIAVLAFVFVLSVVVFVHEMGHFLVARWCGVNVQAFSIGFGKEIFGFRDRKGTRWRVAWIPLGGYVKFMDDEDATSAGASKSEADMTPQERAGAFHLKPLWQRAAVVLAGPMANFIFAIIVFAIMFMIFGMRMTEPRVGDVMPGKPAALAGLQSGDLIREIDGESISSFNDIQRAVRMQFDRPLGLVVERDGQRMAMTITPFKDSADDGLGGKMTRGLIGIQAPLTIPHVGEVLPGSPAAAAGLQARDILISVNGARMENAAAFEAALTKAPGEPLAMVVGRAGERVDVTVDAPRAPSGTTAVDLGRSALGIVFRSGESNVRRIEPGPLQSLGLGVRETGYVIATTLGYIRDIFVGRQDAQQIGGVVRIAEATRQVVNLRPEMLPQFIALISVSIGLINLFPIPLLDGGHLVFYAIEAVRRRPLSESVQEIAHRFGLAVVMALMVFALWNDKHIVIQRWLGIG